MAVLDAAIFAAGGMLLAFLVLVEPYFAMSDLSAIGRTVQVVRALADVCLLALAVRLLMTPEAETPSLQLLAGAAFAWIASDLVWIWLTRIGGYDPGSSGDIGWLLAYALCGAAALHPSMTAVSAPHDPRPTVVRWPFYALLTAAMLAGSAVTAYGLLLDERIDSAGTVAITVVLSLVVIARLALLLRAEQQLRSELTARNEQLLELDQMKDSFVASVSHELRTPLTVIRGFTTTLLDRWPQLSEDDKLVFLHTIDGQGERLNRLVETVLLLSKLESGHVTGLREPLDIADPARDAVAELGVDAGIEVNGETAPYVEGDPDQIHQIFVNLLVNARRYGAPPIRVRIDSGDRNVTVRVSDEATACRRLRSPSLRRVHAVAARRPRGGVGPRPRDREGPGRDVARRGLVRARAAARRVLRRPLPAPRRAGRDASRGPKTPSYGVPPSENAGRPPAGPPVRSDFAPRATPRSTR